MGCGIGLCHRGRRVRRRARRRRGRRAVRPPAISLGLIALGGLCRGALDRPRPLAGAARRWRSALLLWAAPTAPDLLIAENGRLFGVHDRRRPRAERRQRQRLRRRELARGRRRLAGQAEARGARRVSSSVAHRIETEAPGIGLVRYVGIRDPATGPADCADAAVLIAPHWSAAPPGPCLFVGADRLRPEGALAVRPTPKGLASMERCRATGNGHGRAIRPLGPRFPSARQPRATIAALAVTN